ncbi:MAG: toxin-antitoxin system YwqK family antitoxin [Fluviicola sp.]
MAKHALLLLGVFVGICVFPSFAGSDQGGPVNKVDEEGKKQGKWIYLGKDRPNLGFPAEGKIEEGTYKDDRKEGTWIKYHNDGKTPKLKGEYHNNRPSGAYEKIGANGIVIERGTFVKGKYVNKLERFHPDGSPKYVGNHDENGLEEGKIVYYYPNGQEEYVYEAVDGKPTGKAIRYYENGNIKEITTYGADGTLMNKEYREPVDPITPSPDPSFQNNERPPSIGPSPRTKGAKFQPNGYNKVYNDNDEISQDGEFKDGRLFDGKVYVYDEDGILLKVRVFKNGFYHSDGQL